jgi:hypothetical protein
MLATTGQRVMETIKLRPHHLLACSLLLAACDSTLEDQAADEAADDDETESEPIEPAPLGEIAANQQQQVPVIGGPIIDCPSARMIGVLEDAEGHCSLRGALPAGWIWTAMFEQGTPDVDALTLPVPSDLRRFCMYEYFNGKPGAEEFTALFTAIDLSPHMSLDSVASDCRGEFTQGDLNDPSLAFELHDAFRSNIDWIDAAELGATQVKRTPIDMTVVDTVSQAAVEFNVAPENEHGLQMGALIADIACPDAAPNCVEQLRYTLAMPRHDWASVPDWVTGGWHGTQGDVALALYLAVASWQERRIADPLGSSPRLVLNLSLGWQRLTEDANDLERGPAKSLLSALQYASCQGVLVFVAAGNNPDEGCPEQHMGPLAPAMFEQMAAPTKAECATLGFAPADDIQYPVFGSGSDYTPLVHAVGGVDENDRPLINGRLKGRPRLAALGSNGLVATAGGSTEPLTGSSVATAVTTGAAALLWSYLPRSRPDEIVELLYGSGLGLGELADFAKLGSGDWEIHRLSVCSALEKACAGQDPDECPKLECELVAAPGNMDGFFSEVDDILADPATEIDEIDSGLTGAVPVCEQFDWTDLADPQPESPICSRCNMLVPAGGLTGDDNLKMTTNAEYDGLVVSATLVTLNANGLTSDYVLDATAIASLNSPTTNVTVVYLEAPNTVSATLNVGLVDGTMQANPIPVRVL